MIWLTVGDKIKSLRSLKWVLLLVMNQRCCLLMVVGMQDTMQMKTQSAQRPQLHKNSNDSSSSNIHSSKSISKTGSNSNNSSTNNSTNNSISNSRKATAVAMAATRLAATWKHPAVVDCNVS